MEEVKVITWLHRLRILRSINDSNNEPLLYWSTERSHVITFSFYNTCAGWIIFHLFVAALASLQVLFLVILLSKSTY